ncbi:MAG: recombinase family protein, partial [Acidobacteriaceae bacterium]
MGGTVPPGYDVRDRKLYVRESEAQRVRLIFNQFLRLGNVKTLKEWLRENDIRSKKGNHYDRGAPDGSQSALHRLDPPQEGPL